jgi:hypothetical protein
MINRRFLTLVLLALTAVSLYARDNRSFSFGPDSGKHLIVTTPAESGSETVERLEAFAESCRKNPPPVRVSVIITENDFTDLPQDIAPGVPEGTGAVIASLAEEEDAVVLLLLPGNADSVTVIPGARGETAPRWTLEATVASLSRSGRPWTLAERHLSLYRLGWIPGNPLLGQYLRAGIPAIALESGADLSGAIGDLARAMADGIPKNQDRHYLAFATDDRIVFVSERTLVAIVLIASAAILMFLFIFSFLFGKASEEHLRDLARVWWLPFIYLLVTLASLYAGGALASFLFRFRFASAESWTLLPHLALAAKLLLSWFVISLVMALNQLIRFPESGFIYGYIAGISCIVNLFAFSAIDFSLTLLFLGVYLISFVAYHLRHPALQALGILCMFAPFAPYLSVLMTADGTVIAPLFSNSGLWNLRMALFVMPFQLMFSRLFHSLGAFGRRHRFYLPVSPLAAFALAFAATGLVLFMPAWSQTHPLRVDLRETLDSTGFSSRISSLARLGNLSLAEDPGKAEFPDMPARPDAFVKVSSKSYTFVERKITELTVVPAISASTIEITVSTPDGVAVYDASLPFETSDAGRSCRFLSRRNPDVPFTVRFSSAKESRLSARIRVFTTVNPRGLSVVNPGLRSDYLLEIVEDYPFPDEAGR